MLDVRQQALDSNVFFWKGPIVLVLTLLAEVPLAWVRESMHSEAEEKTCSSCEVL